MSATKEVSQSKEKALDKMLDEMNQKHTDTEDVIHNWLSDQDDDELFKGVLKEDRTMIKRRRGMSEEFYLKTKYTNRYLPTPVPFSKRASRRRRFTYQDLEKIPDKDMEIFNIIELDDKYEEEMDRKESEWLKEVEKTPHVEELSLFEEYSDVSDSDLDKALDNLGGTRE